MRLGRRAQAANFRLKLHDEVGSTNDVALEDGRAGTDEPVWHVARHQKAGRGRQGRIWRSSIGNLYSSLLLLDPCAMALAPQLGFVAGVALAQTVRAILGPRRDIGLKWPNDLLCGDAKLAGVLLEATRREDGRLMVVIGIGLNCLNAPVLPGYSTTSLRELHPAAGDLQSTFEELSDQMAEQLAVWDHGRNFGAIRDAWLRLCGGLGGAIRVDLGDRAIEGVFETIDQHGRLVVRSAHGRLEIDAGDVVMRDAFRSAV